MSTPTTDRSPLVADSPSDDRQVTKHLSEDRVTFQIDDLPFTAYVFGDPVAARPYFYPLLGPGGIPMTRRFPMEQNAPGDEPTDHPHHRSLWTSHGDVNGHDNWNQPKNHAYTRFRRLEEGTPDDTLIAYSDYEDAEGNLLCHEKLEVRIALLPGGDSRVIDWQVTLTAPKDAALRLGDTKEAGLCAVRIAAPIQGDRGGTIQNAEGGIGEAECWGKGSRWCDYYGPIEGDICGVAILSHPDSFRHPTTWHVRNYGLFAANPFGLSSFTKGAENGAVELAPGESIYFHYAVVTHRGDSNQADIEDIWKRWSQA